MPAAPKPDLVVRKIRTAHTMANAKRTKYSRRRAGANPPTAGESTVVTMILSRPRGTSPARPNVLSQFSLVGAPRAVKTERSIQILTRGRGPRARPRRPAAQVSAQLRLRH